MFNNTLNPVFTLSTDIIPESIVAFNGNTILTRKIIGNENSSDYYLKTYSYVINEKENSFQEDNVSKSLNKKYSTNLIWVEDLPMQIDLTPDNTYSCYVWTCSEEAPEIAWVYGAYEITGENTLILYPCEYVGKSEYYFREYERISDLSSVSDDKALSYFEFLNFKDKQYCEIVKYEDMGYKLMLSNY